MNERGGSGMVGIKGPSQTLFYQQINKDTQPLVAQKPLSSLFGNESFDSLTGSKDTNKKNDNSDANTASHSHHKFAEPAKRVIDFAIEGTKEKVIHYLNGLQKILHDKVDTLSQRPITGFLRGPVNALARLLAEEEPKL